MGARGGVSILEEALIGTDCCDIYEVVLEDLEAVVSTVCLSIGPATVQWEVTECGARR